MKITESKVLKGDSPEKIQKKINDCIRQGYQLEGPVQCARSKYTAIYIATMVKKEGQSS